DMPTLTRLAELAGIELAEANALWRSSKTTQEIGAPPSGRRRSQAGDGPLRALTARDARHRRAERSRWRGDDARRCARSRRRGDLGALRAQAAPARGDRL